MNKHRSRWLTAIVSGLLFLAVFFIYSACRPLSEYLLPALFYAVFPDFKPAPYKLPRGNFCEVVSVPAPWKIRDTRYTWTILPPVFTSAHDAQSFEFRRIGSRFAVAVQAGSGREPQYSVNKFSFDPAHPAQLMRITDEAWNQAAHIAEPPSWFAQWLNNIGPKPWARTIFLQGGQFRASGKSFADRTEAFLLSPRGRWLVLQSFTGYVPKTQVGTYPLYGSYYLDVYDVHSRRKQFTLKGHFQGSPENVEDAQWIDDHFLVLDLDVFIYKEKFILCNAEHAIQ